MARVRRRWFARSLAAAVVAVALPGCLSPTLPLPPPSKPTVEGPDEQGNVTLAGSVRAGATVYAQNNVTLSGVFTSDTPNGDYVLVLPANVGDEISVWYSLGTDMSSAVEFIVPNPDN